MPDEMVLLGLNKNAFLFDGKDTLSKTIWKDDPQCHRQHSSKMNTSTYWWINFTLNVALSFEHSHAYFACATEESLVQLHCSYDKEEAPIKEWKDYAKKNQEWEVLIYWTGLDDIVSLEEATKIIEINELQDQPQEEHRDERAGEMKELVRAKERQSLVMTVGAETTRQSFMMIARAEVTRHHLLTAAVTSIRVMAVMKISLQGSMNGFLMDSSLLKQRRNLMQKAAMTGKAIALAWEDAKELQRMSAKALDKSPQSSP